jgi:hypothetical protein
MSEETGKAARAGTTGRRARARGAEVQGDGAERGQADTTRAEVAPKHNGKRRVERANPAKAPDVAAPAEKPEKEQVSAHAGGRTAKRGDKRGVKETDKPADKAAKKQKVIRDSFTMPKSDYERIAQLKQLCLEAGIQVKKSELLRAGLNALHALPVSKLLAIVGAVETVKTGRPAKN